MHASDDVVMTILIYAPYSSVKHYNGKFNKIVDKRPRVSQELLVLGSQTLDVLRDAILCVEDFNDTQGDVSENPFDNDGIHQSRVIILQVLYEPPLISPQVFFSIFVHCLICD